MTPFAWQKPDATTLAGVEPWKRAVEGGFEVDVWVVPGASRDSIDGTHGDALKVRVTAPPDRGMANDAVAALLAAHFGAPATLLRGPTSRAKTYRIETRS
jgi:uncharacterized protein